MVARVARVAVVPFAAVALIWAVVWTTVVMTGAPIVAAAGAFDLTCTAGLAMYLLGVRPERVSKRALTATIAIGAVAARVLLARAGDATHAVLAAAITLELAAVVVVVVRFRRARAAWRTAREDRLETALRATGIPSVVAGAIASELTIVRFAVAGWRTPRAGMFTSHRANGWSLYATTFVVLTLVETPLVHIAVSAFGHATAAWILTSLSLYSALWLLGDLHALRHGGVEVTADALVLRLGVRWRARIPRDQIVWAARCAGATSKAVDFSILGANVVVRLAAPHEVRGLLGRRRVVCELALSIDEPDAFLAALRSDPLAVAHDRA
jgi:hypothetical protein